MRLETRHINVDISEALNDHILRRVAQAVRRFDDRIAAATVRIVDENGPRGGIDTRCRIVVELTGGKQIIVEGHASDAYDAVTYAAARLDVQLKRAAGRLKFASNRQPAGMMQR